jgi:transposase-like protein
VKRHYTDAEKAVALAVLVSNRGNAARTARHLGLPRGTIREWAAGRGVHPDVTTKLLPRAKAELADAMEARALDMLDAMTAKLPSAGFVETVVAAGVIIDKLVMLWDAADAAAAETPPVIVDSTIAPTAPAAPAGRAAPAALPFECDGTLRFALLTG